MRPDTTAFCPSSAARRSRRPAVCGIFKALALARARKPMFRTLECVIAAVLCAGALDGAAIRALIVSGQNNHDWRTTTPYLRKLLAATGRFDVRVTEEP